MLAESCCVIDASRTRREMNKRTNLPNAVIVGRVVDSSKPTAMAFNKKYAGLPDLVSDYPSVYSSFTNPALGPLSGYLRNP